MTERIELNTELAKEVRQAVKHEQEAFYFWTNIECGTEVREAWIARAHESAYLLRRLALLVQDDSPEIIKPRPFVMGDRVFVIDSAYGTGELVRHYGNVVNTYDPDVHKSRHIMVRWVSGEVTDCDVIRLVHAKDGE